MSDFYKTVMGRKFYESDLPRLIQALEKMGNQLEESNKLEEKKFRLDERLKTLQMKKLNEKGGTK